MVRKEISKVSKERWLEIKEKPELLDEIAKVLTFEKDPERAYEKLIGLGVEENIADFLTPLSFSGVSNLSLNAIKKITPHLLTGHKYPEACKLAGYDFHGRKAKEKKTHVPKFAPNKKPCRRPSTFSD